MKAIDPAWTAVQRLFDRALDQPAGDREAFVRGAAPRDTWLREWVLELLDLDAVDSPLDLPIQPGQLSAALPMATVEVGAHLGNFCLVERIAAGGMGTVFRAERSDGGLRQEVAIKVLHAVGPEGEGHHRFRQEQRILASLRHPRIAGLLDFGTTSSGVAYLVMELVEGVPITDYADTHQLTVEGRVRLVLQACDAVRHAHRHLVVHRDLKPANILVTPRGNLSLVDFGIAKMLEPDEHLDGAATRTDLRIMTPNYASPEQLFNQPITTATDVWALGVVLFELLVGRRPFNWSGLSLVEISKTLEHGPEPKASAVLDEAEAGGEGVARRRGVSWERLRRKLRGDLDKILARALATDREHRYTSVDELAKDLERHLDGLPVAARSGNFVYVAGRFVRRHAVAVVAAGAMLVGGIGFGILQGAQARQLAVERDLARQGQSKAELLNRLFADVLSLADPVASPELSQAAQRLLDRGAERIRQDFLDFPEAQAELLTQLGTIYQRLGFYDKSRELLGHAMEIWSLESGLANPKAGPTLAALGSLYKQERDPRAVDTLELALDLQRQLHGEEHAEVSMTMAHLASALRLESREAEATVLLGQAVAMNRRIGNERTTQGARHLANWAGMLGRRGELEAANQAFDEAAEIQRAVSGERSMAYGLVLHNKALFLQDRSKVQEAVRLLRTAVEIFREALVDDHPLLATGLNNLGLTLVLAGDLEQAEAHLREALASDLKRWGAAHPTVADTEVSLAVVLREQGRLDEAERILRGSIQALTGVVEISDSIFALQRVELAEILLAKGDGGAARAQADKTLELTGGQHVGPHWLSGRALIGKAEASLLDGDLASARRYAERAIQVFEDPRTGREQWRLGQARSAYAAALEGLGELEEAARVQQSAVELLRELRGPCQATRLAEERLRRVLEIS